MVKSKNKFSTSKLIVCLFQHAQTLSIIVHFLYVHTLETYRLLI